MSRQLTVVRAADITAPNQTIPAWLVEHLWGSGAVGVIGGAPKTCLCRARHNPIHAASRIMPRERSLLLFRRTSRRRFLLANAA
jgi:hypothetical protein